MRSRLRSLLLLALLPLSGCGSADTPAGSVKAQPAALRLDYPQDAALKLDWQPSRLLDRQHGRPVVFMHLLTVGERRNVVWRTFDHPLPKAWNVGQPQADEIDLFQSALAEPIPPGRYVLSVGLYDEAEGYRWPLTAGREVARREYEIATVVVGGPDPVAPKFEFSGGWLPIEKLPNKQVLARRSFSGPASVAVEAGVAGTVRLLVTQPPRGGPPQVRVTSSCSPGWSETVGATSQRWIGVEVSGGSRCTIGLEPQTQSGGGTFPSLAAPSSLDVLAWRPR